jgi:membrane protein
MHLAQQNADRGPAVVRAAIKRGAHLIGCAVQYWSADNASTIGAALAFYCAFSIAPLLVILLTIAGLVVDKNDAYTQVGSQLAALFGASTANTILVAVRSAKHAQGFVATTLSVVTLLIGATTVLAALQGALEVIWMSGKLKVTGVWGWIRTRLLSLGFILTLGFLLLVSLAFSTGLSHLRGRVAATYPTFVGIIGVFGALFSFLMVAALFALIYRYLPSRRMEWRYVTLGGLLTAVLFDAGRWCVGLYLARSTESSAFGAASSFAALLLWLYYTAQIFLFGAEFTVCLGGLRERLEREEEGSDRPCEADGKRTIPRREAGLEATPPPV